MPDNFNENDLKAKQVELINIRIRLKAITKNRDEKSFSEKQELKTTKSSEQWIMIKVIEKYLMIMAILDFTCQIIA